MMKTRLLIFPHQLFASHPGLREQKPDQVVLVEDSLFFGDTRYPAKFHKQKLWLLRASMHRYAAKLTEEGHAVTYLAYESGIQLSAALATLDIQTGETLLVCDPADFILEKRLSRFAEQHGCTLRWLTSPGFLNSKTDNEHYRANKKRWFMADFYKHQRTRLDILIDDGEPVGGKWSFDTENRRKVARSLLSSMPTIPQKSNDDFDLDARESILRQFPDNPGSLDELIYPTSHSQATALAGSFLGGAIRTFRCV